MYLGERRVIFGDISVEGLTEVALSGPVYQVLQDGAQVETGTPEQNGNRLSFLFAPESAGTYTVVFSFDLATEHIKRTGEIYVSALKGS